MIVEPVVSVVLHCSRCNSPFLCGETDTPAYWRDTVEIAEVFKRASQDPYGADVSGWRRTPDGRYLCEGCHVIDAGVVVEKPPLPAVEQARVLRAHAEYARQVGRVAAYELLPPTPAEVAR